MSGPRHTRAEILFLKDVALTGCRVKGSNMASGISRCELSALIYLSLVDLIKLVVQQVLIYNQISLFCFSSTPYAFTFITQV